MGPDNVVFLDFYNKSIQLNGLINMVELDVNILFSRDAFLKDLGRAVGRKVVAIEVSDCIPPPLMRIPDLQVFTGAFEREGGPVPQGFGRADEGADVRLF